MIYFEDVAIGHDIGPLERTITHEQVSEFVGIWRGKDDTSQFTNAEIAKKKGLPGLIVPGAMSIAIMSHLFTGWCPTIKLKKLDVIFRQVVMHDIPLRIRGVVTDKNVADNEYQLQCDVFVEDDGGARLVIGKATVVLPLQSL